MDHDALFKELLRTFFVEFISAFVPDVEEFLDPSSIEFLDKEVFTDVTARERHEVDLLIKARFRGREAFFLIHIENQSSSEEDFAARMYRYFARLHGKYGLPVYPIALLSYDSPKRPEPSLYQVSFPKLNVLRFEFRVIQLNRLHWRDFLRNANPVVAALMTKMEIAAKDRPKVMLECLRMIATLKLDPARQTLIHSFMYAYLRLSAEELVAYNGQIESVSPKEREAVMQILNQWEERGVRTTVLRQLTRKFGHLPAAQRQIENLSPDKLEQLIDAVLDFQTVEHLQSWLVQNG